MTFAHSLLYAMGSFSNTLCDQARARVIFFYNDRAGLLPSYTGPMWAIYGVWNALNDPLMGQLTDRTRSRWGRRVPYLLFGAIPLGISFFLLWTPPAAWRATGTADSSSAGNQLLLAGYFFATLFVFDALFTLTIMAYNALYADMTSTPKERANVSAMREGMGVFALILASLVPLLAEKLGYAGMGALLGVATAAGYLISVAGVHSEHRRNSDPPEHGIGESFGIALSNVPFRFFLGANLCKELIFIVPPATLGFYAKYAVPVKNSLQESLLLLIPFVLVIPCLWVWSRITPRIGVKAAWSITFASFIPGCVILFFAPTYAWAQLGTLLIAPGLAGLMMLPHMMISAIIDDDALRVGHRRAGVYYGINGALIKLAIVVHSVFLYALPLTGFITPSRGAPAPVQPESAVWGIRFLMGGIPALACFVALFMLWFLRLPEGSSADTDSRERQE